MESNDTRESLSLEISNELKLLMSNLVAIKSQVLSVKRVMEAFDRTRRKVREVVTKNV